MVTGRPLKFKSAEELQVKIDAYFDECDKATRLVLLKDGGQVEVISKRPYTITGLALALDCDRDTLLNYEEREEFFGTIKKAKLKCQNYAEEYLYSGAQATGAIFNLKNNYGWIERNETDLTTKGESINPNPELATKFSEFLKAETQE